MDLDQYFKKNKNKYFINKYSVNIYRILYIIIKYGNFYQLYDYIKLLCYICYDINIITCIIHKYNFPFPLEIMFENSKSDTYIKDVYQYLDNSLKISDDFNKLKNLTNEQKILFNSFKDLNKKINNQSFNTGTDIMLLILLYGTYNQIKIIYNLLNPNIIFNFSQNICQLLEKNPDLNHKIILDSDLNKLELYNNEYSYQILNTLFKQTKDNIFDILYENNNSNMIWFIYMIIYNNICITVYKGRYKNELKYIYNDITSTIVNDIKKINEPSCII